jgi:hypothetical protein
MTSTPLLAGKVAVIVLSLHQSRDWRLAYGSERTR